MKIIKINLKRVEEEKVDLIVDYFKKGKVVVYPTDTIYGLGCLATDNHRRGGARKAIRRIYKIKKRERGRPLLILAGSLAMMDKYCKINNDQKVFLKSVWFDILPNLTPSLSLVRRGGIGQPVTVILKSKGILPKELLGTNNTLAVRLPRNEFLIKIIRAVGAPIVSTSANISGKKYRGDINKIIRIFKNKVDLIVDAGELKNRPSIIIDITDIKNIRILRK